MRRALRLCYIALVLSSTTAACSDDGAPQSYDDCKYGQRDDITKPQIALRAQWSTDGRGYDESGVLYVCLGDPSEEVEVSAPEDVEVKRVTSGSDAAIREYLVSVTPGTTPEGVIFIFISGGSMRGPGLDLNDDGWRFLEPGWNS